MIPKLRFGRWAGVMCVCASFTVSCLWVAHAQDKQGAAKVNPFQGTVTPVKENSDGKIAHFYFAPGSRTRWHSHEGGQIILVEKGVALEQEKGGPVIELHAGQAIYCPPGVVHWHGAAPNEGGTQYNVSRGGITWLGEVTDKEYNAKPKPLR
jgi:quercetin dioxygenase-like cupin family protein